MVFRKKDAKTKIAEKLEEQEPEEEPLDVEELKRKVNELEAQLEQPKEELPQPPIAPPTQEPEQKGYIVTEMATETTPIIYNPKTGEQLDVLTALAKILNLLEDE